MTPRPEQRAPPADPVPVERVGGLSSRPVLAATVVGAVVVGILALSPWATLSRTAPLANISAASASSAPAQLTASPIPTSGLGIDPAKSRMRCNGPRDWRLVTVETGPLGDTRTTYGAEPVRASGPDDPLIPTVRLSAARLFGFGLCAPAPEGRVDDAHRPFNGVRLWTVEPDGAGASTVQTQIRDVDVYRLGEAYFAAPIAAADQQLTGRITPSWRSGRYVLEIDGASGDGSALWIALDFAPPR